MSQRKQVEKKADWPNHISNNTINMGKCLYAFYHIRVRHDYDYTSDAMREGAFVHEVIHQYTKACKEQKVESDFELIDKLIDEKFEKTGLSESVLFNIRPKLVQYAENGVDYDAILDYEIRKRVNVVTGQIIDTKTHGDDITSEITEPVVEVVLDRVNGYKTSDGFLLEIIDFKNQRNILNKSKVEIHPQLKLYRYIGATFLYPGAKLIRSGIYHTQYNSLVMTDATPLIECGIEFENTAKFIQRQWERLLFSPKEAYETPTQCEYCLKYSGCPIMNAGKCKLWPKGTVMKRRAITVQDKVRAARKLNHELKTVIMELKTEYESRDIEVVDGTEVGYSPSVTKKYPMEEYREWAIDRSVPISHITIGKMEGEKHIKKMLKSEKLDDSDVKELNKIKTETTGTRFSYGA